MTSCQAWPRTVSVVHLSDPPQTPAAHSDVTSHIREQLQSTLGAAYTLDRELGGGELEL